MKDKILKVVNHYGILNQLKYMSTEQFELNEAVINAEGYRVGKYDSWQKMNANLDYYRNHVKEELADNLFMLKQIQLYFGITDEEIQEVMNYKIDRQIERIENGN